MREKYPVEDLLRPAYEYLSAFIALINAAIFYYFGTKLSLPNALIIPVSLGFVAWMYYNGVHGWMLRKYQKNLKKLKPYKISLSKLNFNSDFLFMGKGFQWTEKHTQRLLSCGRSNKSKYVEDSKFQKFSQSLEYKIRSRLLLRIIRSKLWFNPFKLPPDVGGSPLMHGVGALEEEDILQKISDRKTQCITVGQSGVGKTRSAEVKVTQDIHRDGDNVVISIEPKGDADYFLRKYVESKKAGKLGSLRIFHMAHPEISCVYNPLGNFVRITEIASKATISVSDAGDSKAFKDFAWDFVNNIAAAVFYLGQIPDYNIVKKHYRRIDSLFVQYAKTFIKRNKIDLEIPVVNATMKSKRSAQGIAYSQAIKEAEIYDSVLDNLMGMFDMDRDYYSKVSNSLIPFLAKVTTGKLAEILNPSLCSKPKPVLDWQDVIKQNSVVYFGLDSMLDGEVARSVGEAAYADLVTLAGYMYHYGVGGDIPYSPKIQYKNIFMHCDELSDLLGEKFIPLINKSRGAGFHLQMYTQTLSDLIAALGSEAKADQVLGSIGTMEFLRVQDVKAAQYFISKLPTVRIKTLTDVSGARQGRSEGVMDFTSDNEDRITDEKVPMLEVAHFMSLPKGQSFILKDGNTLYKNRIPEPDAMDMKDIPSDILKVADDMRRNYQSDFKWDQVA